MAVRNRTRILGVDSGTRRGCPNGSISTSNLYSQESVEDVTGLGDNNPFDMQRVMRRGGSIYGRNAACGQGLGYTWSGYHCTYQRSDPYALSHLSLPGLNYATLASEVLKRTSPERSSMNAIVSLAELRELPGLVQQIFGKGINGLFRSIPRGTFNRLSRAGKINLMIQFGILPMIGDLKTLMEFQALVDQRVKELERLRTRGLRRTIDLDRDSAVHETGSTPFQTAGSTTINGRVKKITQRTVRGHIRWYPSMNFNVSDSNIRAVATKIVSGNVIDFTTIYELMPWSWLIDYFTNLGDFVGANRNIIPVHHSIPTIMVHTRTEITSSRPGSTTWSGFTQFDNSRESKTRRFAPTSLSARQGFLTESQTSILGSLAVTRRR